MDMSCRLRPQVLLYINMVPGSPLLIVAEREIRSLTSRGVSDSALSIPLLARRWGIQTLGHL